MGNQEENQRSQSTEFTRNHDERRFHNDHLPDQQTIDDRAAKALENQDESSNTSENGN